LRENFLAQKYISKKYIDFFEVRVLFTSFGKTKANIQLVIFFSIFRGQFLLKKVKKIEENESLG